MADEHPGTMDLEPRVARAVALAVDGAHRLGLDGTGARPVRVGTAVLVQLPAAQALARVDDVAGGATATRQVTVAAVLAAAGVPAIRPVGVGPQPVVVADAQGITTPVTVWAWEHEVVGRPDPSTLGHLARHLHDATAELLRGPSASPAPWAVPMADPITAVETLLADLEPVAGPGDDLEVLATTCARLRPAWAAAAVDAVGVVHGDLHPGNVLVTDRGLVLADLELAGVGPWAYDLAPAVVATRRYGAPVADLVAFVAGYGRPLPDAEWFEPLIEVYELWVTAWSVAHRRLDADHEREAVLRMARWRGGPTTGMWTLR